MKFSTASHTWYHFSLIYIPETNKSAILPKVVNKIIRHLFLFLHLIKNHEKYNDFESFNGPCYIH